MSTSATTTGQPAKARRRRGPGRPRGGNDTRLPASEVVRAIDEIIERLAIDRPYPLLRYIATRAGVHPTTVMRVHKGILRTTDPALHHCVLALRDEIRRDVLPPFAVVQRPRPADGAASRAGRVTTRLVREQMERVLCSLGMDQHQFLIRYLASRIGTHPTTVLRYYRGDLRTAPARLLDEIQRLQDDIDRGQPVAFCRSSGGDAMVLREQTLELIQQLLDADTAHPKSLLFKEIERRLGLRAGTIGRIYYDHKLHFVRADIHEALARITTQVDYDPCRIYAPGERLRHHLFGLGTVERKVHKNKILVRFDDDHRVLLAEAVPVDPFLCMRSGGRGLEHRASA